MESPYHEGQRRIQERYDSVRLADRLAEKSYQTELDDSDVALIARQRMFFLATSDSAGEPSCTFRGGDPGFVRVIDRTTLLFPEYDGNGQYLALGNMLVNPRVHLLFMDFDVQTRLRVAGRAELLFDDPLLQDFVGAKLLVRVAVEKAFPNCKRYIPKLALVEEARHVPRAGSATPVAEWKQTPLACDYLPADDPARVPISSEPITE
jgi:predicted pyridoxine 5'-phosphate oxidase superfamily flavin-nucleotide-binding protein